MYFTFSTASAAVLCMLTQVTIVRASPLDPRFLDTTIPISINTTIPPTTDPAVILSLVQNPITMITINPLVKSFNLEPNVSPMTFDVTDKLLTIFSTSYTCSFTNTTNGMDTVSSAAAGLTLDGHWTVEDGQLREFINVTGSELVMPFVKGEIQSSHQDVHTALMAMAANISSIA